MSEELAEMLAEGKGDMKGVVDQKKFSQIQL